MSSSVVPLSEVEWRVKEYNIRTLFVNEFQELQSITGSNVSFDFLLFIVPDTARPLGNARSHKSKNPSWVGIAISIHNYTNYFIQFHLLPNKRSTQSERVGP